MRQVIVLSVALVVALVASYVTWTDDTEERDDTAVEMYRAEPEDIVTIAWESKDSSTTITRRTDTNGEFYAIDSVVRKEKRTPVLKPAPDDEGEDADGEAAEPAEAPEGDEAPDAEADDPHDGKVPDVEIEIEETESHFVGNEQASKLWGSFAPLTALRELLVEESPDPTMFGLEEPSATITVTRGEKVIELTVGAETYGSKDLYVGYADRVFLVDNKILQPLQFASQRLVERALHPVVESEATTLELTWPDGTTRTWNHDEKTDSDAENARPKQVWSDAASNEADETAATWIDKLLRLRLRSYLTAEEEEKLVLTRVFEVTLADEEGSWLVEVFEAKDDEGNTNWYAKSPFNRATVLLTASLARGVVEDLGNLKP